MRCDAGSRSANEESSLVLTVRAGLAVIGVAAACLPYVVAAAVDAARAAWHLRPDGGAGRRRSPCLEEPGRRW